MTDETMSHLAAFTKQERAERFCKRCIRCTYM